MAEGDAGTQSAGDGASAPRTNGGLGSGGPGGGGPGGFRGRGAGRGGPPRGRGGFMRGRYDILQFFITIYLTAILFSVEDLVDPQVVVVP